MSSSSRTALATTVVAMLAFACSGGGGNGHPDVPTGDDPADMGADTGVETLPDVPADPTTDLPPDPVADAGPDVGEVLTDGGADTLLDVPPELPPLAVKAPLPAPTDPLAGTSVESCPVFLEERCHKALVQRCHVYDPKTQAFVAEPDPMLKRVFLTERWRDLYNSPDGMTSERSFGVATPPGTPESKWSDPARFASHDGMGDSGIWTGWTVVGSILRYSQTGTEADYLRMERGVRTLLTMYDVSGVPGYFIRYFFLLLPKDAPNSPDHVFRYEGGMNLTHHDRPVDPAALAELPAVYTEGVKGSDGTPIKGKPMWHGRPSIDQNTGPMNALPMAYALLRDENLKTRIAHHLTCYLKRLQRVELIHLQSNPDLLKALTQYFAAGELKLDPDDIDLKKLDRIVGYVQRQINTANEATFDRTCPDTIQMTPWRVVDASSDTFLLDLLDFVNDMDTKAGGENQIDHYYFPSLRGGDAVHLMHLAVMAYWFTGDEQYRTFLFDELIGNLHALDIARTAGAFDTPKFCKSFFGDQLTYGSWWALLDLLPDSPLRTELQQAFHDEMWDKLLKNNKNADFELMYAGSVPESIAGPARKAALDDALAQLAVMGGNGWAGDTQVIDDPRRSYTLTPAFVSSHAPAPFEAACPTQQEYDLCTAQIDFMGIQLPGLASMDYVPCDEADPWQCKLPNGKCTDRMTASALPVNLRQYTDFLWQRNPFELRKGVGLEGGTQMPGADVSEPYWNARRYGFITAGTGQVLAWETVGKCE